MKKNKKDSNKRKWYDTFGKDYGLYVMSAIPILWYVIFCYIPMGGIVIAFQNYNIFQGIWGSDFVGLAVFKELFGSSGFINAFKNTIVLGLGEFLLGAPAPIILALMLNEIRLSGFKKITQSLLYIPHFMSWIIVGGLLLQMFSLSGFVNSLLTMLGLEKVSFLTQTSTWVPVFLLTGVWKSAGWGTIIYLAALTGINPELYEAARVDGAGRLKCIWNITLPCIFPTIAIVFILSIDGLLSVGFEKIYALSNSYVSDVSDVIATYIYRVGIESLRYNISTAAGLFQGVITLVLVWITNTTSKKLTGDGILW
ncbi:MAG: ABC transporter permease subunit [Lachnospiraceae bacterium]